MHEERGGKKEKRKSVGRSRREGDGKREKERMGEGGMGENKGSGEKMEVRKEEERE